MSVQIIEAEQAVLGAMLIDSECVDAVMRRLRSDDFSLDANRRIWDTVIKMRNARVPIDGLTVAAEMKADQSTRSYLAQLMEITPTAANVMWYVDIVSDRAKRRRLVCSLKDALDAAENGKNDDEILPNLRDALDDNEKRSGQELLSPADQVDAFFEHRRRIDGGEKPYTRTGYKAIDSMLCGGLLDGGLYYLAARPGVGKTAFALEVTDNVAKNGGTVVFVSMEMSAEQIASRRFSALAGINSKLLLTSTLTDQEYSKIAEATNEYASRNVYLTAGRALPIGRIISIAQSKKGVRLVVVDHFTLITRQGKQESFVEYAEISHALKRLAQSINCPVLCLIQINREGGKQKGRPHLADLRGTGAAEEDADGVFIMHRPDDGEVKRGIADPIVEDIYLDKNRFGETGRVTLNYWPQVNRFRERFVK